MMSLKWLGFPAFFFSVLSAQAEVVSITQAAPLEKLDPSGQPCGVAMAHVGDTFSLLRQDGNNLILKASDGSTYLVGAGATNYIPSASPEAHPSPSNTAAPPQEAPAPIPAASAAAGNPESTSVGADDPELKHLNEVLGLPLLADGQFWNNKVEDVAQRLDWPQESKTKTQESYRRYAIKEQVPVAGAGAYSLALYGKDGKPTYLSIIFANAGDFSEAHGIGDSHDASTIQKVEEDLAQAVKKDFEAITTALTSQLGPSSISLYGNSASNRDEVHRWNWHDVAFLLNSHQGRYVSLKIVPADVADHYGTVEVTDRDKMRDILASRVLKRDNGDVVVTELPMVDQGPKGYCVPATWERYLRYMDVPADLYVLAIMGNSGLGGGTIIRNMRAGVADYVSAYHRRIEDYDAPLDVAHVARYIDQGLPLMWTCWIKKEIEIQTYKNTESRKDLTDWSTYRASLVAQDKALGDSFQAMDPSRDNGHMRLIIGYNTKTNEVAISDSWGEAAAERWLYAPTALRISQGELDYLSW